jgi:shikimate kinase
MTLPPNIILIGFMGSGKTSTGKELSKILNFYFLDTDQWIEEKNKIQIPEIFEKYGEAYFRKQEKSAIHWLESKKNYVISTGGGSWFNSENRKRLLKLGWCVWLRVSSDVAWERVGNHLNQRPLLAKSKDPFRQLEAMLTNRAPIYALAQISIDTNSKNPKEVASEIFEALKKERPFDLPKLQK